MFLSKCFLYKISICLILLIQNIFWFTDSISWYWWYPTAFVFTWYFILFWHNLYPSSWSSFPQNTKSSEKPPAFKKSVLVTETFAVIQKNQGAWCPDKSKSRSCNIFPALIGGSRLSSVIGISDVTWTPFFRFFLSPRTETPSRTCFRCSLRRLGSAIISESKNNSILPVECITPTFLVGPARFPASPNTYGICLGQ